MILYNHENTSDYGKGLKLASGSITLSLLASWFVSAAYQSFSPSEAIIVLLVLISLSFPAKCTLLNARTIIDETRGLIILLVVELGTCGALLWTFARLIDTLPTLGTDNVVFFFAKVALNGWFKTFALIICVIDAVTSIQLVINITRLIKIAWKYKRGSLSLSKATEEGDSVLNDPLKSKIERILNWSEMEVMIRLLNWLIWILVVIAVELTLRWNHLSPSTTLRSPGQLIPFATGIIIFTDSVFVAVWPRHKKLLPNIIAGISRLIRICGRFGDRCRELLQLTASVAVKFARDWWEHNGRPMRPSQNTTSPNIQIGSN